jgi:hypothetical protein
VHGGEDGGPTRRELISRGLVAGALAGPGALAGAGALAAATAEAATKTDAELLMPVLAAELLAVFAYKTILHSELMSAAAQRTAARMLPQEHAHASTFSDALLRLGSTPLPPLKTVAEADALLAIHRIPNRLAHLRTERDCLTILVRVENVLAGVYYRAIPQLSDPHLLGLCAQVLATEGQHACVLNLLLRPHDIDRAVPSSYVQ